MNDETMLAQLSQVKGQLSAVMGMLKTQHESTQQLLTHQHSATNQRIDDLRLAMGTQHAATEKRIDGLSSRVTTLEGNERATALKGAGVAAVSGGVVAALMALLKFKGGV